MRPGLKSRRRRHMWEEFVVGSLSFVPRGFSAVTPVFPSPQKPTFPNSNSTRKNHLVDALPLKRYSFNYFIIVICSKLYYRVFSIVFLYIPTGGTLDQAPTPLDGMNVWNTISNGDPSPRKEILLNIDVEAPTENSFRKLSTEIYEGIALRAGDMKLLLSVPNASWYKPPELDGESSMRQYTPFDKNGRLGWFQDGEKVFSSKDIFL